MKKYKFQCWHVAFRKHSNDIENNNEEFLLIPNSFCYWAADPFVLYKDGMYYIFAELFDKIIGKGRLGYCILSEQGKIMSKWKVNIKSPVHMSFPNLMMANGKIYLMPESGKEYELRYYESVNFPKKWVLKEKLLEGVQVCDTIEFYKDYLWCYNDFTKDKKAIIYQKVNNGIYKVIKEIPDEKNCLRPGGKAFEYKGNIVIPFQNGDGEYGKSLFFTAIDYNQFTNDINTEILFELSDKNVCIKNLINPIIGIHTYNFDKDIEVIDVKTRVFTWSNFVGLFFQKFFKKKHYESDKIR